jgi:aspartyl-tRNA(Asn)/glutamyl-tRNA(Gln) amidotransferase subunit B
MSYEIVIGFEVHTELKTHSKVWCGCPTHFGAPPNTQVCPICLGMPGTLPVLNGEAFRLSLETAVALNCQIPPVATFDRKNYYYPDLPKNYQISQNDKFIGKDGWMDVQLPDGRLHRVRINNIHLEEDAGKNIHPEGKGHDYSLVDLNRAGTPLLEIVTEPDIRTREEAQAFMLAMRSLLQYLGVSDCKMQEGSLRFELNMSLRPYGSDQFGTKVEVKNLNSMSVVLKCIDAEYERQSELLDDGRRVLAETRLWDEAAAVTRAMRSKETANDYRYFPDPDLVDVEITAEMLQAAKDSLPELPLARRQRFIDQLGLPAYDAGVLTAAKSTADYFEAALGHHNNPKALANWVMTGIQGWLNEQPEDTTVESCPVTAAALAEMVRLVDDGIINSNISKKLFPLMLESGEMPAVLVEKHGLKPMDDSALDPLIEEALAANPKVAEDIRGGKLKAIGAIMGAVMRKTGGRANPDALTARIKQLCGVAD